MQALREQDRLRLRGVAVCLQAHVPGVVNDECGTSDTDPVDVGRR